MPDRDIKTAQIYNLLVSIAKRKSLARDERKAAGAPHISVRLRQHLDAIFRRAIIRGLADANPVAALKVSDVVTLPPTRHNRALEADELKRLLDAFTVVGTALTRLAVRLLLLTSVRTIELRGTTWREVDLKSALWSIPGERMKMGLPHVVPLSVQAIEILREIQKVTATRCYVGGQLQKARLV